MGLATTNYVSHGDATDEQREDTSTSIATFRVKRHQHNKARRKGENKAGCAGDRLRGRTMTSNGVILDRR